ncbi:MAG: ATP-dependent DNA helicase RecG [Methylococcaceae bacterium]
MNLEDRLSQPVEILPGIGPKAVKQLNKIGLFSIQDLLLHLPFRYQDRTQIKSMQTLKPGETVLVGGKVQSMEILNQRRNSLLCQLSDGSGYIALRFFHFTARQQQTLQAAHQVVCFGEVREGYMGLEMVHPDYQCLSDSDDIPTKAELTAVYPTTEGLRQNVIRRAILHAMELLEKQHGALLTEWLPSSSLSTLGGGSISATVRTLHTPGKRFADKEHLLTPYRQRLAFEELLAHFLSQQLIKQQRNQLQATAIELNDALEEAFIESLPFALTQAQQKVIGEIQQDLSQPMPMQRLLQGDVGSGKTIIAAYAALLSAKSGLQVVLMAPTELLAEQHFQNFSQWLSTFDLHCAYLSGRLNKANKAATLEAIAQADVYVVIGTHAVFQDSVQFKNLGLIMIDEQHRFGVQQRLVLREKGSSQNLMPHQLFLTATPIPRTLAMMQYSDLAISTIDQLPPGRKPIETRVIAASRRQEIIHRINDWVAEGHQAYWVCTLIEESEKLQCQAAEDTLQQLVEALPNVRIELLHGRMKSTEKDSIMQAFKNHQADLLVATTVIEVGVDVPNADLMIIENAERLGLSQLHQLRGRVGRGGQQSYCMLLYQPPLSDIARERLAIIRQTQDGFQIAEKDLELRGPGERLGIRQTGQMQFRIADLERDKALIPKVQEVGEWVLHHSPDSVQPIIARWVGDLTQYAEV